MKNPLGNIMQQAQKMQENFKQAQEEIAALRVSGEAGGGLVKVDISGEMKVGRIQIDDSLLGDDKEMLEDLVAAAVNDALQRIEELKKEKMASMTSGFNLPAGFKMPF